MTITEFLNTKPMVKVRRGLGGESDWLEFCKLTLASGDLYIVDPAYLPGLIEGLKIKLPPGDYDLSGRVITYWQDSRISRLRIILTKRQGELGNHLGSVATDHGLIGAVDHDAYIEAWTQDSETFQKTLSNEIPESGPCKIARLGTGDGVLVPFVESGFGDGTFQVFALEDDGSLVGVEVVFIDPNQQYPF